MTVVFFRSCPVSEDVPKDLLMLLPLIEDDMFSSAVAFLKASQPLGVHLLEVE